MPLHENPFPNGLSSEKIAKEVLALSSETSEFILEQVKNIRQEDILIKASHDYVTYVDKTAEKTLVEGLGKLLPKAGFITEEGTVLPSEERLQWIIDPLDGTTNFIHGIPMYCISIALYDRLSKKMLFGLVHELNQNEQFYATSESPAFLNDKEIRCSQIALMDKALIATGFPYYDYDRLTQYMKFLEYLMMHTSGVRRLGSAALDLAYVACGRFEVFYEYGLRPWDVAAGAFLVERAGGKVGDFSGGTDFIFGKEIVSANALLYDEFLESLMRHMKKG